MTKTATLAAALLLASSVASAASAGDGLPKPGLFSEVGPQPVQECDEPNPFDYFCPTGP